MSMHYPSTPVLSVEIPTNAAASQTLINYCHWNPACSLPLFRLLEQFAGNPDQHAVGKLGFQAGFGEFIQHLGDSQAVVFPKVIEQPQSMILWDGKQRGRHWVQLQNPHLNIKRRVIIAVSWWKYILTSTELRSATFPCPFCPLSTIPEEPQS